MKDRLKVDRYPICAEKARYVIEAWRQHEGLPSILQRAYATANYLDKRTIYIDDDELIAGNVASRPMGMEASVWGPFWDDDDLDGMVGEGGKFSITPEDRAELRSYDSFWAGQGRQFYEWQGRFYDDWHLWPFIRSGILCPPWKDREKGRGAGGAGFGWGMGIALSFFVPDYAKIVSEGVSKTLHDAEEALHKLDYQEAESFDKAQYLKAVIIALSAMVRMYHRYGDACLAKAAETADPQRKKELARMADTCHWIAENPSRDFRDALQNFYFYWMMIAHGTTPGGRFDQYMYPYYKHDIETGAITDDEVLELLEMLRVKIMQFNFVNGGAQQRDKWAGMARWHNFLIGLAYLDGIDVGVDSGKALKLITGAAEAGLEEAIRKLVAMYHDGKGVERDYAVSASWQEKLIGFLRKGYESGAYKPEDRRLFLALWDLGDAYYSLGNHRKALATYQEMQSAAEQRYKVNGTVEARRDLSVSYNNLGDIAIALGDLAGAKKWYEQGLAISTALAEETGTVEARRNLSISYDRLGNIAKALGDPAGAKNWYEQGLAIRSALAEETGTLESYDDLAVSYFKLGILGDMDSMREAYAIWKKLAEDYPEVGEYKRRRDIAKGELERP